MLQFIHTATVKHIKLLVYPCVKGEGRRGRGGREEKEESIRIKIESHETTPLVMHDAQ
jgi:hypothetical protein